MPANRRSQKYPAESNQELARKVAACDSSIRPVRSVGLQRVLRVPAGTQRNDRPPGAETSSAQHTCDVGDHESAVIFALNTRSPRKKRFSSPVGTPRPLLACKAHTNGISYPMEANRSSRQTVSRSQYDQVVLRPVTTAVDPPGQVATVIIHEVTLLRFSITTDNPVVPSSRDT